MNFHAPFGTRMSIFAVLYKEALKTFLLNALIWIWGSCDSAYDSDFENLHLITDIQTRVKNPYLEP
jgi:hypothetical protein